jgi:hypothetical protein
MKNRRQREPDQGRCERAAEDHDGRVQIGEHSEIAAHQNKDAQYNGASNETEAGCNIHRRPTQRIRARHLGGGDLAS